MRNSLPVILQSGQANRIAFPVNTAGTVVAKYAAPGLRNNETVGVMIDKIAFVTSTSDGGASIVSPTALVVELRWKNEPITASFVSLAAITWPANRGPESTSNPGPSVGVIQLSKPFYLEPGEYISVGIRNDFAYNENISAWAVDVIAIGRQAARPPAERWIPYLCNYVGPTYTVNSGNAISDQSTAADLGNPFTTNLVVERMIGRVLSGDPNSGIIQGVLQDQDPTPVWNTYNMTVSDHHDNAWVPVPTPLPLVCNATDRSWILNHTLEPKGYLRVGFEGTANAAGTGGVEVLSRAVVGLVGYRRIA